MKKIVRFITLTLVMGITTGLVNVCEANAAPCGQTDRYFEGMALYEDLKNNYTSYWRPKETPSYDINNHQHSYVKPTSFSNPINKADFWIVTKSQSVSTYITAATGYWYTIPYHTKVSTNQDLKLGMETTISYPYTNYVTGWVDYE